MSTECVLLARRHLGLPEGVQTREGLAKLCQNRCQHQRAESHTLPRVDAPWSGQTIPVHFSFSPPLRAYVQDTANLILLTIPQRHMHGRLVRVFRPFRFDMLRETGLKEGLVEHRPSSGHIRNGSREFAEPSGPFSTSLTPSLGPSSNYPQSG